MPYGTPSINEQASVMTTAGVAWAATSKSHVWLLIGSGVVAAAQIGKAVISVPLIRADLGLGLDLAGRPDHRGRWISRRSPRHSDTARRLH